MASRRSNESGRGLRYRHQLQNAATVVTLTLAVTCSGVISTPAQAATPPTWVKVAEGCANFNVGEVQLSRCYMRYKINNDGNGSLDYYRIKATLTGYANSGRRMEGIRLRAVPMHSHMKFKPVITREGIFAALPHKTYKFTSGCAVRDMSLGITVPVKSGSLTGTYSSKSSVCRNEWIAPHWSRDLAHDWGARWDRGSNRAVPAGQTRSVSVDVTVSVPQGKAGTWALPVSGDSCADNWQYGC